MSWQVSTTTSAEAIASATCANVSDAWHVAICANTVSGSTYVNIKQERKHIWRTMDLLEQFLHDYVSTSSVAAAAVVVVVETFHYLLFVSVARY